MPRPTARTATLAAAVAAELAVGTLLVAPAALAEDQPAPAPDPGTSTGAPTIRTGRTDEAPPAPEAPVEVPADPGPVRTGRVGDVPALVGGEPTDGPNGELPPATPTVPAAEPSSPSAAPERDERHGGQTGGQDGGPTGGQSRPASGDPATADTGTADPPPAAAAAPPPLPAAHTVVPGDNLWEIAAAHLALATARARTDLRALDIAPYWTRVCLLNREHLRSGDVSLIYAGEVIDLPAP